MATGKNSKVSIETGQTLNDYAVMTDSGDSQIFTMSGGDLWSGKSGFAPIVRPNGITSGRNLLSAGTTNDTVRVAAHSAFSKGTEQEPTATSITVPRPTSGGYYKTISVIMASDGSIDKASGAENSSQSEVRNAAGGPPYIPVNDVELGQVRVSSSTSAAITAAELFQVPNQHSEFYDQPNWDENNIGDGESAAVAAQKNAYIKFSSVLPSIHTGGVAKKIFLKYYEPIFAEVSKVLDFKAIEISHSVTSQEYYRGSIASVSETVGQGGFTALLNDALTDAIIGEKNQTITVKHWPDENKNPFSLSQGRIGLDRSWPVAGQNQAEITISGSKQSAEFSS